MRKNIRARVAAVAAVTAGALLLGGCAAGTTDGGDATASTSDELVVALSGDIDNFDPHTNQLIIYEYAIRELVFSSLVDYDVDLNLQGDLAESFEANEDATVFTFHLQPDAVFHDGTAVDSAAVIESLERAASGTDSIWSGRLADVQSYDAPDDATVVITLNTPNAAFLAGLASIAIVAPSGFDDASSSPVGSGPYQFVSWTANDSIVLERFDDYFGEPGATQTIEYRPVSDQQVALNSLYSGDIDIISSVTAATADQVQHSLFSELHLVHIVRVLIFEPALPPPPPSPAKGKTMGQTKWPDSRPVAARLPSTGVPKTCEPAHIGLAQKTTVAQVLLFGKSPRTKSLA